MSSEHENVFLSCRNCFTTLENNSSTNSIRITDISDIGQDEIQIIDAISYVYGISWEEFLTASEKHFRSSKEPKDGLWLKETPMTLCDSCTLVLSDNYKAHKRFEELSHDSSFIHAINKFRRREWEPESVENPKVKGEIDDSSENHGDVDADLFYAFNHEELDDVPDSAPETKYKPEGNENEEFAKCLDSTVNQDSCKPEPVCSSSVTRSLRTRQVSIKLDKLSNKDLKEYKVIPKKDGKKHSNINKTGPPGQKLPKKKKKKVYECKFCGKTFSDRKNFVHGHLPKHYGITVNCDICGKTLATRKNLKLHKKSMHSNEEEKQKRKIPCKICGKLLTGVNSLRSHMQYLHTHFEEFKCETCSKVFLRKQKYDEHMLTHSEEFTPYLCGQCGKTFSCKAVLAAHEKIHVGEKFPCDICSKQFSTKTYLERHQQTTHVTERKFVCDECGKSYKFKPHLALHLKLHKEMAEKGEMSVQCDECGKYFKHSLSLYKHKVRSHRSDLPKKIYQCSLCDKILSDSTCLRTHKKLVHKIFPDNSTSKQQGDNSPPIVSQNIETTEMPGILNVTSN